MLCEETNIQVLEHQLQRFEVASTKEHAVLRACVGGLAVDICISISRIPASISISALSTCVCLTTTSLCVTPSVSSSHSIHYCTCQLTHSKGYLRVHSPPLPWVGSNAHHLPSRSPFALEGMLSISVRTRYRAARV